MTRPCDLCDHRTCVCEPLPEPNPNQDRIDRERDERARAFWAERDCGPDPLKHIEPRAA